MAFFFEIIMANLFINVGLLIAFILLMIFSENESWIQGMVATAVAGLLIIYGYGGEWMTWDWVTNHVGTIIAGVLIYFTIGVVYTAFWKWRNYCKANADPDALMRINSDNDSASERYLMNSYGEYPISEETYYRNPNAFALHPSNHYDRLTTWMMFWPFSFFWTILHDPLTWIGTTLYDLMSNVFFNIAKSASRPVSSKERKPH